MISFTVALNFIYAQSSIFRPKKVGLISAFGSVLAKDIFSPIHMPSFRQSAMDGFAIKLKGSPEYKIINELKAGGNGFISLSRNEAAIMALLSFPLIFIKATAFILNIFVSGFSFWFSKEKNHFEWKLFYPFDLASVPAVFIGGFISIIGTLYEQIPGIFLLIAFVKLMSI